MKNATRILSLMLALCLLLGTATGAMAAGGAQAAPLSGTPAVYDTYVSTGDNLWEVSLTPIDTKDAIDAMLDIFEDFGYRRVYWRGLQQALWNQVMVTRDEAVRYVTFIESMRKLYSTFNPDRYFVQEAHKRGMEVWGVSNLQDLGNAPDTPFQYYPAPYDSDFRINNPDWVPKDKYGFMEQGGPIDFSYPEAREYLINLHVNEVEKVGYDGVLFLTYTENFSLRYHDQFGFNEPAMQEFKRRYGITPGKEPFTRWASLDDWRRLRGEYLTVFLRELKSELGDKGLGMFLDPRNPYAMQIWQYDTVISNAIHLDLETWVAEGLIDQFLVNGASSVAAQVDTMRKMMWMTRGTDTKVSIYTTGPLAAQWQEFKDQGAVTVFQASGYGEELYYRASQPVRTGEHIDTLFWLSEIVAGTKTATLEQLVPLLDKDHNGITMRRMALKALAKLNPPGGAAYAEAALEDSEPGVRGQAVVTLRTIADGASAAKLLAAVDAHADWTLFEAAAVTLGTKLSVSKPALVASLSGDTRSDNPRVRAVAMRALSYGAHADLLNLFKDAIETEFAPAGTDSRTEIMYYNNIRYYAAESLGKLANNAAAVDALIEAAESDDTVASSRAASSLGDIARRGDPVLNTKRAEMVTVLSALFGQMGTDSVRVDRDWAYRPIGEALLALGADGKAVLEGFMNGSDLRLAEFAWKCLYLPQNIKAYTLMTEAEYDAAYSHLPDSFRSINVVRLSQSFDDEGVFVHPVPPGNGWAGDSAHIGGRWGGFGSSGVTLDQTVRRSEKQSAKLIRGGNPFRGVVTKGIKDQESYRLSFWVYRGEKGSLAFQTKNSSNQVEIWGYIDPNGLMNLYDPAAGKHQPTGITIPEKQWTLVQAVANRRSEKVSLTVTPEDGAPQESTYKADFTVYTQIAEITFTPSGDSGTFCYIDDVLWEEASAEPPARPKTGVTLSDRSVAYNGQPQSILPQANPAWLSLSMEYEGIGGTVYPKSKTPPVNAGNYRVTATVTEPGYQGTATATLTIRKAMPAQNPAGSVTASGLEYGESLGASVISGDGAFLDINGDPLTGSFSWDEGNEYVPAATGPHPYTFTPDDANYDKYKGTVQVSVNLTWEGWITRIDQDFDDATVFKPEEPTQNVSYGDATTAAGLWRLFKPDSAGPLVSTEKSYSEGQSIKLGRGDIWEFLYGSISPGITPDADYELGFMLYRLPGKGVYIDMCTANTNPANREARLFVDTNGKIKLWDISLKEGAGDLVDAQLTVQAETWTRITLSVSRSEGHFTVSAAPAGEQTVNSTHTAPLPATPIAPYQVVFQLPAGNGDAVYLDDILLREKTTVPQTAAVAMDDQAVDYDGQPHGLTASATPVGIETKVYYTGIGSTAYTKSETLPTDAGTYRVTALVTEDGWAGTANATLTIRPAQPGGASSVTVANDTLDYGQTLGAAGLAGEFLDLSGQPLDGSLTWDEGDSYAPLATGERPYTFIPNNPNYAVVHGKLTITVIPLPGVYVITATASAGGSITPSGPVQVAEGEDQTFTFIASSGYRLLSVTVDSLPQSVSGNNYTFENVTDDHTIHAAFEPIPDPGPSPAPGPVTAPPSAKFSESAAALPYIEGYPDGSFQPERHTTRAELAQMLYRLAELKNVSQPSGGFGDVPSDMWAAQAIQLLAQMDILPGLDGGFKPDQAVTRGQAIRAIALLMGKQPAGGSSFADSKGHPYEGYISAMEQAGIAKGYPDGSFRPDAPLTRAEMVTMINRALGKAPAAGSLPFTDLTPEHWAAGDILAASKK